MENGKLFDFNDLLQPHGEDKISYEYNAGKLDVKILYDELKRYVLLNFTGVAYQYFAPVPGYYPEQVVSKAGAKGVCAGCVYELFDTELLRQSEEVSEKNGYKSNRRHFSFYLEWENVSLDVIARDFNHSEGVLSDISWLIYIPCWHVIREPDAVLCLEEFVALLVHFEGWDNEYSGLAVSLSNLDCGLFATWEVNILSILWDKALLFDAVQKALSEENWIWFQSGVDFENEW